MSFRRLLPNDARRAFPNTARRTAFAADHLEAGQGAHLPSVLHDSHEVLAQCGIGSVGGGVTPVQFEPL
jgi:hypothetical protein